MKSEAGEREKGALKNRYFKFNQAREKELGTSSRVGHRFSDFPQFLSLLNGLKDIIFSSALVGKWFVENVI